MADCHRLNPHHQGHDLIHHRHLDCPGSNHSSCQCLRFATHPTAINQSRPNSHLTPKPHNLLGHCYRDSSFHDFDGCQELEYSRRQRSARHSLMPPVVNRCSNFSYRGLVLLPRTDFQSIVNYLQRDLHLPTSRSFAPRWNSLAFK